MVHDYFKPYIIQEDRMSDCMLLHLTRITGESVSINAGAMHSVEDIDGHTVVVCGDDVYHVRESRYSIEQALNMYLDRIVNERLDRMEADPNWEKNFLGRLLKLEYKNKYELREEASFLYKKLASRYAIYEAKKEQEAAERLRAFAEKYVFNKDVKY